MPGSTRYGLREGSTSATTFHLGLIGMSLIDKSQLRMWIQLGLQYEQQDAN